MRLVLSISGSCWGLEADAYFLDCHPWQFIAGAAWEVKFLDGNKMLFLRFHDWVSIFGWPPVSLSALIFSTYFIVSELICLLA